MSKPDTLALSDDAKAVAGAAFGLMAPGIGELVFLTPSRITPRAKAALDELVSAGVASCEPHNHSGGLRYRPLIDCHPFMRWLARNKRQADFALVNPESKP